MSLMLRVKGIFSKLKLFPVLLFLLLGITIYSNTFNSPFVFDDLNNISNNHATRNFSEYLSSWDYRTFRFIGYLTFSLNYQIHQYNLFGYHLVNLLIHILNTILVWSFIRITFLTPFLKGQKITKNRNSIALFAALIFLTHPIQTQAVTYVTQRFASLATFFYLLSIYLYARARLFATHRYIFFIGSGLAALMGIYTKEIVFTLPLMIFLYEIYFFKKDFLKKKYVLIVASILTLLFTWFIYIRVNSPDTFAPNTTKLGEVVDAKKYLATQPMVIMKYIQLLFIPINQNIDHDFLLAKDFVDVQVMLSALLLLFILGLAIVFFKKNRLISFSIIWFFVTLSVESSFIPLKDVINEHRLYLPMFGFSVFIPSALFFLTRKNFQKILFLSLVIIISSLGFLTYKRNAVYSSEISLWTDVVKKAPLNPRAALHLANAYLNVGRPEIAQVILKKTIEITPNYVDSYSNLGVVLAQSGKYEEAEKYLNRALVLEPKFEQARYNMGLIMLIQRKYQEAEANFLAVIKINPDSADAYEKLGVIYFESEDFDKSRQMFEEALRIQPDLSLAREKLREINNLNN